MAMKPAHRKAISDGLKRYHAGKSKGRVKSDKGYVNIGGARVKNSPKAILKHVQKTFPNVKKVNDRGDPIF